MGEYGKTGGGRGGAGGRDDRRQQKPGNGDKIGRNVSEGEEEEEEKGTLTSSFCKHHKRRTARGSSLDGSRIFDRDGRWKRRSPLRENRNYA